MEDVALTTWQWCAVAIASIAAGIVVTRYLKLDSRTPLDPNSKKDDRPNTTQGGSD
jgi:hypothetical protein